MPPRSNPSNVSSSAPAAPAADAANASPVPPTDVIKPLTDADIKAKLEVIAAENKEAMAELETYFGAKRWPLMMVQAKQRRLTPENVATLCGNMRRTRRDWTMVQGNDKAALILAANHLLVAIGSKPSAADEKALEDALNEAPAA